MAETSDDGYQAPDEAALERDIELRRNRISHNLDDLSGRLQPEVLIRDGFERAKVAVVRETGKIVHEVRDIADDMTEQGLAWARTNQELLVGGAVAALAVAAIAGVRTRRGSGKVPVYQAYNMEYRQMGNSENSGGSGEGRNWDRVKGEAESIGNVAGEAYYAARSKAAGAMVTARVHASEAADAAREKAHAAAETAREAAHDARVLARDAADRAREAAGEAGEWAKRQPEEHPVSLLLGALAVGLIAGALLPRTRREDELLGSSRESLGRKINDQARSIIDIATTTLEEHGINSENALAKFDAFADTARNMMAEAGSSVSEKLKKTSTNT